MEEREWAGRGGTRAAQSGTSRVSSTAASLAPGRCLCSSASRARPSGQPSSSWRPQGSASSAQGPTPSQGAPSSVTVDERLAGARIWAHWAAAAVSEVGHRGERSQHAAGQRTRFLKSPLSSCLGTARQKAAVRTTGNDSQEQSIRHQRVPTPPNSGVREVLAAQGWRCGTTASGTKHAPCQRVPTTRASTEHGRLANSFVTAPSRGWRSDVE